LVSGWNHVRLKFEDYDTIYPADSLSFSAYIDDDLNLAERDEGFNYFILRYRGTGQPMTLYLTSLSIERNRFDEDAHFNKGVCLTGNDFLQIPATGLTLSKGTIEFWFKSYYDSYGRDIFNNISSRTIFSIVNNTNNIVSLGVKSGHWFELTAGHARKELNIVDATSEVSMGAFFDI
jgi:hypothetical protein